MDTVKNLNVNLMPLGNRTIYSQGIQTMKQSIMEYGIIRPLVLFKTDLFGDKTKLYIADGQHLFMACNGLNKLKDLPYILCKKKFKDVQEIVQFVGILNSTQRGWRLGDYVGAYASTNQNLHYNTLENKHQKYGLSYGLTAMVYGGYSFSSGTHAIKNGTFEINDVKRADKICEILQDIVLFFGRRNSTQLASFTLSFYHWYSPDNYNHSHFLSYLKKRKEDLVVLDSEGITHFLQEYRKTMAK